jgi:Protein of unknown function (DUF3305)
VSGVQPVIRIPVGVVIERRRAKSAWTDFVWRPVAILPGVPDVAPWTVLEGDAECTIFYGGSAEIVLRRSDASGYRENVEGGAALLWVVIRPTGVEPRYEIAAVTAEPSEGEALTENAAHIVETVPMPEPVRLAVAEFIAAHHVERPFIKRQRDHADPELMARRSFLKDRR